MDLLFAAVVFAGPLIAGMFAAYRIGANPGLAVKLACVALALMALPFLVAYEIPFDWPRLGPVGMALYAVWLFVMAWGMTGKLIWDRESRRLAKAGREQNG
jgi:hypothetical protein